jgi:hypothetical protein
MDYKYTFQRFTIWTLQANTFRKLS